MDQTIDNYKIEQSLHNNCTCVQCDVIDINEKKFVSCLVWCDAQDNYRLLVQEKLKDRNMKAKLSDNVYGVYETKNDALSVWREYSDFYRK